MEPQSIAPSNWRAFLRIGENKTELFRYLSKEILRIRHIGNPTSIVCAYDNVAEGTDIFPDLSYLSPTNHEEGDTRVLLHMKDMVLQGNHRIVIRTVDTDVLVLPISTYADVYVEGLELWVDFGAGKNREFFPIHQMCNGIGSEKAVAIRFFHSFTGCDQNSYFSHVTKHNAWKLWQSFPEVTDVFTLPTANTTRC